MLGYSGVRLGLSLVMEGVMNIVRVRYVCDYDYHDSMLNVGRNGCRKRIIG